MATPQKTPARAAAPPAKQPNKPTTQPAQAAKPATAAKPAAPAPKPAEKTPTTAVAERQTTAVATSQDVPDYIRQSQGRGSENVEMQDLVIPRIELVQALSHCLEDGGAEYIEGAKPGMFYNSVTRELYGASVPVCPVFFKKQHLVWKDRKKGGGFGGAFDSAQEAHDRIAQEQTDLDAWEAVETHQQIVLVVNPDTHETSEAVLSCARTKQKVSRQWNSLIRVNGFDRFSRIYELFGVDDENNNGDKFKNIGVRYVDFASMPVYKAAEALYNSIASGERAVKIDDEYIDVGMGSEDQTPPGTQAGDPGANTEY
jgi:hypothetical protein